MNPKQYLGQIQHTDNLIKSKLDSINQLKASLFSTSSELKQDKIQSSNSYDFTDTVAKVCDMEADATKLIDYIVDLRRVIENEICQLDNNLYQVILINHYVLNKSLIDIASEFTYEYGYVRKSHGWALEAFKEKFPEKF